MIKLNLRLTPYNNVCLIILSSTKETYKYLVIGLVCAGFSCVDYSPPLYFICAHSHSEKCTADIQTRAKNS